MSAERSKIDITPGIQRADEMGAKPPRLISMASSSLLARNATINLITEGWIFLVLIVAMPKLVTFLGDTSFGLFSLAWVVIGYLSFLDIGVNRAATKFVSEYLANQDEGSVRQIVATAFVANFTLGLVGGIVVAVVSPILVHTVFKVSANVEHQALTVFYAAAFAVPVLLIQGIFRAVLSSYQRFSWINGINAAAVTVQWGAAALLAWKGYGVALVVLATVIARLLAALAYGLLLSRLLPSLNLFRIKGLHDWSKLLRFGGWVSVSQVISPLLVYLDRMLIASFVSLGAVTLYTVPYEAMTRLRIIPSSLATTLYPAFSERGLDGQEIHLQRLYERSVRYLLLLLVPCVLFLVFLGPDVLTLWMGSSFSHQTSIVIRVLALGVLANGMSYVPYNMLQALGRPDLTGKFHVLELPPYIAACIILIPHWGIAGAALASTMRFILDFGLLFWAVRKYCKCSLRDFWTRSFQHTSLLGLTFALALLLIVLGFNNSWIRIGFGVLAFLLYIPAGWFLIVGQDEKPKISQAVRMFLRQPA